MMDAHLGFDEVRAPPALRNSQAEPLKGDVLSFVDNALFLYAQHVLPLRGYDGDEGGAWLGGCDRETMVVVRQVSR
jgi:hypothetical protein